MSEYKFDPRVPYSQEAEAALLGALLTNPGKYHACATHIKAGDFFLLRHGWIFESMTRAVNTAGTFDYLTVGEGLKAIGHYDEVGGMAYLLQLVNNTPTSVHAEVYARLIQRAAYRRRLLKTAEDLRGIAMDEAINIEEVKEAATTKFLHTIESASERRITTAKEAASAYYDMFERLLNNPVELLGIPSGFKNVDLITGGMQSDQMIVVAGRPGMGKTAYIISMALQIARGGWSVVIWTGEMSEEEYSHRIISILSGVELTKIKNPSKCSSGEQAAILEALDTYSKLPIIIDDTPSITIPGLYVTALEYKARGQMDVLMLDRLGLMSWPELDNSRDETLRISKLSTALKGMARQLSMPVVVVSQLNRGVEQRADKRPMLSDLRQSGAIEQDADCVQFIYRDEVYNEATEYPNQADIIIAKNRNGPTGTATLYFEKACTAFKNADKREINVSRSNGHAPAPTHTSKTNPF